MHTAYYSVRMRFIVYANTEQIDTILALSLYPCFHIIWLLQMKWDNRRIIILIHVTYCDDENSYFTYIIALMNLSIEFLILNRIYNRFNYSFQFIYFNWLLIQKGRIEIERKFLKDPIYLQKGRKSKSGV